MITEMPLGSIKGTICQLKTKRYIHCKVQNLISDNITCQRVCYHVVFIGWLKLQLKLNFPDVLLLSTTALHTNNICIIDIY